MAPTPSLLTWAKLALLGLPLSAAIESVLDGADPTILQHPDGNHYAAKSGGGGVSVHKAAGSLTNLAGTSPAQVWTDDTNMGNIWAPEIIGDDSNFYIYFAAGATGSHRTYVISSSSPDASYSDATHVALPDDKWAIDGALFRYNGELWFVWSGWEGDENVEQNLYICRMESPTQPTGPRYIISQPREAWERVVGNPFINEGPEPIVDPDGQLHIVYSADGSWSDSYCLGDLRLRKGGDPTHVWDWYKSNGCVFGSKADQMMAGWEPTSEIQGPGHHTFALPARVLDGKSLPDTDYEFMYHGVPVGTPYEWENRKWYAGTFRWAGGVEYTRENVPGATEDIGWGLRFSEVPAQG